MRIAHPARPRRAVPLRTATPIVRSLAGPAATPAAPGGPAYNPYDYTTDAGYQQQLALNQQLVGDAQAQGLSQEQQLAIAYGDPAIAQALGLDAGTAAAAGQNPFSIVAHQRLDAANKPRQLDQGLNPRNLYYSSARSQGQSDLARSLLEAQTNSQSTFRNQIAAIKNAILAAQRNAQQSNITAGQSAAAGLTTSLGDLNFAPPAPQAPQAPAPRLAIPRPAAAGPNRVAIRRALLNGRQR